MDDLNKNYLIPTCFVFHVNNDCRSADIFIVMLSCRKERTCTSLHIIQQFWIASFITYKEITTMKLIQD